MEDRTEEKIRNGWRQVAEDSRDEWKGGANAGLPPVTPGPAPLPSLPVSRHERVGPEPLPPSAQSNLTPGEKKAVYAMLRAAIAQLQMDGSVGTVSEISPELETALEKLRS